ncbi:BnaC08g42500D [Brassica napus]|uniref:BnaC08g42500D protein n=1 Tax=Brassica napus TaxID=3708 RepID=A0A078GB82_BRANA|nr:BnaC08g42500D [Brassica napus]
MAALELHKPEIHEEEDESSVEEVRLTVSNEDDPSLPVWTFRMWFLGLLSCVLLSFLNTFFGYRTQPLMITMISVQVVTLPLGKIMARILPETKYRIGSWEFSFNPGPFNVKEHVLISMFANAGAGFGSGIAYAVGIVDIIMAFYKRKISFLASWILVITTQILGYGWAGIMRKLVVDPAQMWWPTSVLQVSLFRALHEKDKARMSRGKFFVIAFVCSFAWYIFPAYLFLTLSSISWVCWAFPKSITAQQIGSGMSGLGLGSFALDWSVIASYLGSPLVTPFFAIVNVLVGYVLIMYMVIPISYWGMNVYEAHKFPIFSSDLFDSQGQLYNISTIVNDKFELDEVMYQREGRVYLSTFFAITYGIGFAAIVSTLTHVALFNGKGIWQQIRASTTAKVDIHTRLMKKYKDIPSWWFYSMLAVSLALSLVLCTVMKDEIQMPWWGLLLASFMALIFTVPVSIITATTNQTPGLNIITEYLMGVLLPGRPIANVVFKTYGYISMSQAISFLNDFKLGHYMKIPPRSMFLVQFIGTIIAGTVNISVAWYLLTSVENICQKELLPPNSPWTCPSDRVFFDASVIWGLVGPKRIFGSLGNYPALNWFFLGGLVGPVLVWLLQKAFPTRTWISQINLPVLLGATAAMPPATSVNFNCWIIVGVVFNYFVFKNYKKWWQRYNYVLSAALDAGLAFMGVLLYFSLTMNGISIGHWWGAEGENCPLASCPTAPGVHVEGCPRMATESGEITIVCNHCDRDIPAANIDLHRVHCARLEKCNICGDMVPKKHADEHFLTAHAPCIFSMADQRIVTCEFCEFPLPAVDVAEHQEVCGNRVSNTRAGGGGGNGRRRRDGNGVSYKRLFFTVAVTGIAVLMGSLFFQRKPLRGRDK